ncbi:prolactin isoform X2 [Phyllopteryx taeniolatus]|uniref:prolactin isoform X2 n=1 Tax=Phyllopteryx taeniolatus TaxID=161469 RepID=UPI002AD3C32C|nr:prolactin isoform X2 [Phyllopteryx taeniolatus]
MLRRRCNGRKPFIAVLYMVAVCSGVPVSDLLDRASQHSDKLHSLSTTLTHELESELLSLARSLLRAWVDPLVLLSSSADTLPHPSQSKIISKIHELQEHSNNLGDGLNVLSGKMEPAAQSVSSLPYRGGNDMGQDKISKLIRFQFLLSCFRRDSHKIDSFLKVLRCRAAKTQPHLC